MSGLFICPHGLGYRVCKDKKCKASMKYRDKVCAKDGHIVRTYENKTIDPETIETRRMCISCKKEL